MDSKSKIGSVVLWSAIIASAPIHGFTSKTAIPQMRDAVVDAEIKPSFRPAADHF